MGGEKGKEKLLTLPQTRFFAGLFTDLSAGWYGVVFITPSLGGDLWKLTKELFFALVCSWLAIKFEEEIK